MRPGFFDIFFCVAGIIGLYNAFKPGMIFGKLGDWLCENFPPYITKPLFECPICMASIWGVVFMVLSSSTIGYYLWFIPAVSGCIYLVINFIGDDN